MSTPFPIAVVLLFLLEVGCLADRDTLEPLAQARGDLVLDEVGPAIKAGIGMAAVGAELCGYTLEEWQDMGSAPDLPSDLEDWFGIDQDGALQSYSARGQYTVTWGGARFFQQDVALVASVATPMSAFSVYITEAGDAEGGGTDDTEPASDTGIEQDESGTLASAVLATSLCGTDERKVTGTMSYPISVEYEWSVTIEPAEDEAGAAFAADALFPSRGSLTWSGSTEIGRATLTTDDASAIADGQWPATISGRGWSASVGVLLE